jgi:hypothetical protein
MKSALCSYFARFEFYGRQYRIRLAASKAVHFVVEKPITVTAQFEAWNVFACSNAGILGSNLTWGMDVIVRLFCVCVVLRAGRGLATSWSPVQGVLPTVLKKLKKRPRPSKGL